MADKELQAHDFVRRRNWSRAIALYDQLLASTAINNFKTPKDRIIACLLGRCECLLELGKYESCITDAKRVLKMLNELQDCSASVARVRRRLIHSLYKLKRFQEAEIATKEWIQEASSQPSFMDISKTLERYRTVIQMANGQKTNQRISLQRLDDEMLTLDTKLEHWATNNLPLDKFSKLLTNKGIKNKRENGNNITSSTTTLTTATVTTNSSSNSMNISNNGSNNGGSINNSNGNGNNSGLLKSTTEQLGNLKMNETSENLDGTVTCSYCATSFLDKNELRQHCQTESHQNVIMSDEGRDWKWRPPPRGYTIDSYTLCESYSESQSCHYGNQCVEAHGIDELNEWKERFEYRKMRLQRACEKELYGKSYTEELLEKWIQATSPDKIMCEKIDGVEVECSNELVTSISSKISKRDWLFILKTKKHLKAVALLQDAHRHHFTIKSIIPGDLKSSLSSTVLNNSNNNGGNSSNSKKLLNNSTNLNSTAATTTTITTLNNSLKQQDEIELKSDQEWVSNIFDRTFQLTATTTTTTTTTTTATNDSPILEHKIKIAFTTDIYGTFRQSVCFDFGAEPVLVKHLCVDVVPVGDAEKIQEIKKDIINSSVQRWDDTNTNLIKFETVIGSHLKTEAYLNDMKREKDLLERYPCPRAATFTLTQSTILEKRLTKNNYRSRIHELLYIEEIARYEQIARYNLTTKLRITSNYMLTPSGMATSTAKYSHSGELFGLMQMSKDISEDTSAGRLILSSCTSVYLSATLKSDEKLQLQSKKREVYEAVIEDKGKNIIYLKLSSKCVQGLNLKPDTDFMVDIQFQLNRLSYCEWHNAIDKITDFRIIFPDTFIEPNIPWTPKKQWSESSDPKLNAKQKEAINAITTPISIHLPPILLIGPFGTGKTYTLAQAIKQLLNQPEAKVLICTHSNSAADLYIKEYLHPWVEKGLKEATPLRVYYHKRWVATVNSVVQKYCIIDGCGNFRRPTIEDILKHRIVVVTLSISMELASLGLPKGYFTHIFLDEAAQAMECEAIMPLALASETTRIVLAGDHMQMSPELFSNFAKERKLHISLLERLYDHYPSNFPCKILLCENYRAHEAIIKFTSELFYEQKLIASGKQPKHDRFYPLTFFTTRGEDVQDKNSTAFYNNSEVYEVVERVCELRKKWPSTWGKINDASIGIMTPYADQVFRIRSELRKRRMGGISVERVLNVQGKQFRAIFLSTVRTRRTCTPNNNSANGSQTDDSDYGFLSNSKLLNTAITRAQSLVAVVGDPVALCSIGRCRKVWERFIDICNQNKSLFGITWSYLRSQLDGVELKRSYVLNPLAPEFIPRALQPESYLRKQTAMIAGGSNQQLQMLSQAQAQLQPIYNNHSYNMLNQSMLGPQMGQKPPPQVSHQNSMQIRPMGGPLPPQSYNFSGQPQITPNQQPQQFSQYMIWPPQQQQPPPPPNQMMRPNYPAQPPPPQPIQPPQSQQMPQNPNANLWGPPPQSNPWGVIPKSVVNSGIRSASQTQQPPPPQQTPSGLNINLRPTVPPPLPATQTQPSAVVRNPVHDPLTYLRYNNQNPTVLGQLNMRNPLHNGPSSPAALTGPQTQDSNLLANLQRNTQLQHTNNLSQHPYMTGPQQIPDKKEFQFLNNVHNIPMNLSSSGNQSATILSGQSILNMPPLLPSISTTIPQQQTSIQPFNDYSVLLPPNMTFYDMALEPKENQYKWYLRLLEVHGQEAANKFTEILRQVMSSTTNSLATQAASAVNTNTTTNKNILGQTQPPSTSSHSSIGSSSSLSTTTGSNESNINFNQQIDLVFNSLMNGNDMSQPILRDLLGMVGGNTPSSTSSGAGGSNSGGGGGGNSNASGSGIINKDHYQFPSNQLYSSTTPLMGNTGTDLCLSSRSESVPLYRRQVMGAASNGNYNSVTSSSSSSSLSNNIRSMVSSSTPDHLIENNNSTMATSTAAGHGSGGGVSGAIVGIGNHLHNNSNHHHNNNSTTSSSLIESLFSGSDLSPYTNVNSIQKLFYNYQLKQNADDHLTMMNSTSLRHSSSLASSNNPQQQQQHHQLQQQQSQHNHHHLHSSHTGNNMTNNTTYAAVLTQGSAPPQHPSNSQQQQQHVVHLQQQQQQHNPTNMNHHQHHHHHEERDPFAAIRELGQRSNGYYNYFQ